MLARAYLQIASVLNARQWLQNMANSLRSNSSLQSPGAAQDVEDAADAMGARLSPILRGDRHAAAYAYADSSSDVLTSDDDSQCSDEEEALLRLLGAVPTVQFLGPDHQEDQGELPISSPAFEGANATLALEGSPTLQGQPSPPTEPDEQLPPWLALAVQRSLQARSDRHRDKLAAHARARVKKYISVKTALSATTGTLVGLELWAIGAPIPAMFGLITFVLNFIPSIGSWLATAIPIPFILFDPDQTLTTVLLAIALPAVTQVTLGDVTEPMLLGKLCHVHPIVVLACLLFFGYLWGIGGMVLAVPITICIKIICKQMSHPFPRYIAGIIYGDVHRYVRKLDRDVLTRMHKRTTWAREAALRAANAAAEKEFRKRGSPPGNATPHADSPGSGLEKAGSMSHADSSPGHTATAARSMSPAGEGSPPSEARRRRGTVIVAGRQPEAWAELAARGAQ